MALSAQSLAMLLFLINLLLITIMFYARGINKNIRGTGLWTIGVTDLCIGILIHTVNYFFSFSLLTAGGNILQLTGALVIVYACGIFIGNPFPRRIFRIIALCIGISSVVMAAAAPPRIQWVSHNLISVGIYLLGVFKLAGSGNSTNDGGSALIVPFIVLCLFHLYIAAEMIDPLSNALYYLSPGMRYSILSALYTAIVMTLIQQGYYKFRKDLNARAEEKEMLLREMHHRTKNNLALINSMVALDMRYIRDQGSREILDVLQKKINTIMLLHQQLQAVDAADSVEVREYLGLVVDSFAESLVNRYRRIDIVKEIEPISLSASAAIPIGLIVNELIANCRKHAFSDSQDGKIIVRVGISRDKLVISVTDNGKGLDGELKEGSLGLSLVRSLTKQVEGSFRIDNNPSGPGVRATLRMPYSNAG